MSGHRFRALSAEDRALVAVAVLLDGVDAAQYLEIDSRNGTALQRAASDLASLALDVRVPYVGTLLRLALGEAHAQTGRSSGN